jgi:hypothetical protein
MKFLDTVHPRIEYIKIDKYDTWSMDSTLSPIILPMLKQLKECKHGAPWTDDEDVPEGLRSTSASPKENEWDTDDNHFKRWDWIMDEMIFAFEELCKDDWQREFYENKPEEMHWDKDGWTKHNARIQKGLELFGKYYRNLWD